MKTSDSREVPPPTGDLDILVARIHEDLRKERKARAWRDSVASRHKALLALLIIAMAITLTLYVWFNGLS